MLVQLGSHAFPQAEKKKEDKRGKITACPNAGVGGGGGSSGEKVARLATVGHPSRWKMTTTRQGVVLSAL